MVAGPITTSPPRSKLGSIDRQRLLLVQNTTLPRTIGPWLVCSLRWQQVTSCSSQEIAVTRNTPKTMTISPKWWSCLVRCQEALLLLGPSTKKCSTGMVSSREFVVSITGPCTKSFTKSIGSNWRRQRLLQSSSCQCLNGIQRRGPVLRLCLITLGLTWPQAMRQGYPRKNWQPNLKRRNYKSRKMNSRKRRSGLKWASWCSLTRSRTKLVTKCRHFLTPLTSSSQAMMTSATSAANQTMTKASLPPRLEGPLSKISSSVTLPRAELSTTLSLVHTQRTPITCISTKEPILSLIFLTKEIEC